MTRDKEIIKAATEARMASAETLTTRGTHLSIDDVPFVNKMITYDEVAENAFIKGAQWADSNPKSPLTDLSQVWHSPDEEPEEERQVVAIDSKHISYCGAYRTFYQGYTPRYAGVYWNAGGCLSGSRLLDRDKIVKWAYVDDLLPKIIK